MSITELQKRIGAGNAANGWHDRYRTLLAAGDEQGRREHVISKVMLVVTELAEAVEELRNGRGITESYVEDRKPEGFPVELADVAIRVLDLAEMVGIDLGREIQQKLDCNASRGVRHGGKTI